MGCVGGSPRIAAESPHRGQCSLFTHSASRRPPPQMYGQCVAAANSPAALVERGLRQWLELGVPRSKLVLGLPWYAYDYPCQPAGGSYSSGGGALMGPGDGVCHLEAVPFMGAPCSDAAGRQREYQDVMQGEGGGEGKLLSAFLWMVHRTRTLALKIKDRYSVPTSHSIAIRSQHNRWSVGRCLPVAILQLQSG